MNNYNLTLLKQDGLEKEEAGIRGVADFLRTQEGRCATHSGRGLDAIKDCPKSIHWMGGAWA